MGGNKWINFGDHVAVQARRGKYLQGWRSCIFILPSFGFHVCHWSVSLWHASHVFLRGGGVRNDHPHQFDAMDSFSSGQVFGY